MVPYLPYPRRTHSNSRSAVSRASRPALRVERTSAQDLQSQLEAMLDAVWKSEADWRFNDRLDMAVRCGRGPVGGR